MKYSEIEVEIQKLKEIGDVWSAYEKILLASKDDEVATNLARKVIKKDIKNMIEKIQGIFQRESANFDGSEGKSEIEVLVEWLEHIQD